MTDAVCCMLVIDQSKENAVERSWIYINESKFVLRQLNVLQKTADP